MLVGDLLYNLALVEYHCLVSLRKAVPHALNLQWCRAKTTKGCCTSVLLIGSCVLRVLVGIA